MPVRTRYKLLNYAIMKKIFMKKHLLRAKRISFLPFAITVLFTGCTLLQSDHFITDVNYRKKVRETLEAKKKFFADPRLFSVFEEEMSLRERESRRSQNAGRRCDRRKIVRFHQAVHRSRETISRRRSDIRRRKR